MSHPTNTNRSTTEDRKPITVTHITIRQSIFILALKLAFMEAIAALFVILFHGFIFSFNGAEMLEDTRTINLIVFLILVAAKTALTFYVLAEWVDEYYEVTRREIKHKWGIIIKHEDENSFEHMATIKIEQGVLGRIFNYGTLTLYNWASEKEFVLYLIHNPQKHLKILKELLPTVDIEKKVLREKVFDMKEDE